ncbi:ral GTPase-activating protein subunit alpha-2-like isoform X1 [Bolinopsis microptera]|uniref:ral GTPase-activating protein subunit alpha-2-like isoform X1 n=1 Tax=Bolinopsis microptera TaxID=2820187 RepID=UPI0030794E96
MKSMKLKKPKDGSCISKFADLTKSPKERLHAFLQAKDGRSKDQYDGTSFLRDNCGEIIFLIYEAFWHYLDHVQLKKHKKSGTEEADLLEIILPTLERVLQFLPDKINDLWHYHGIARMLKEILASANSLAPNNATVLKRKGIKLTILWILGLMDKHKHNKQAVDVFNTILPELKHPELDSPDKETIVPRFQFLLDNLTCNIREIHWPDVSEHELRERRIEGFKTVFNLCKKSYLEEILRGYEKRKEGSSKHRTTSEHRYSTISTSSHSRRHEIIPEHLGHASLPPAPPPREHRLERVHSSTSSHRSDADTPTSPLPLSLPTDDAFTVGCLSYLEDEEVEQRCSKCRSAGHSTRSCPRCERCKNSTHRSADCPTIIEKEVENHFNKPMNDMTNEQLDCIFQLNDRIMKWFVKHGKSILPHDKTNCMFVTKVDDVYKEDEKFEEDVEVCRIVDRVLFTDRDNVKLMNDAFEHGPLVLQRRTESNFAELMSPEEHQEFSFIKMITLYSELIYNIKDYNVLGNKTENQHCPEFLADSRLSSKKRRQKNSQVERKIKSFLKSATLNVAPLLRYPYSYSTFSGPTKKMIEQAAQTTMGYYNVIVQQIEQADANTCFRIILCMIKSIEHNFDLNFPIHSYEKQLRILLNVVRFVGRKVSLPHNTWTHLRDLLIKLEKRDETAPLANDYWHEVMKTLTQEIFVQVYGVEWKANSEKDEKAPKAKGKLQCHIEEKSHLNAKFNAALSKLQRPFRSEKPTIQKSKTLGGERSHARDSTEYHYHGLNKIFLESVSLRNRNNQPDWDDQNDDDDELRPNNGEHPIILWRRFLTLKGNPNKYAKSAVLHKRMFESLSDILDMLLWLDDNKEKQDRKHAGSNYRDSVPDHPVFTYIYHILPWFFEAFLLNPSEEFLPGKKAAMRMLCKCLVRLNPIKPPVPLLHLFYNVLLNCLKKEGVRPVEKISYMGNNKCYQKTRQDLLFEVVRGTKHIFSINLNGCQLHELMKCLSEGAISVLDATLASGPKADAIILLGSLYTYPWADELLKQQIVVTIKDVAKSESDQFNRSRAIQMVGYMIMTMLSKRSDNRLDAGPESPTLIMNRIETSSPSEISSTRSNNKYADVKNLIDLINIVMLQVRSTNSKVALSALSVVRDVAGDFDKLLLVDSTLPKQIIEVLLSSLNQHMDAQRRPVEEYECGSPTKSSPTPLYDPLSNSQSSNLAAPKAPPAKDNVLKSYQEAVITGTIMALVDWVLSMPEDIHNTQVNSGPRNVLYAEYTSLLKTVFKVLQLVALEKPFNEQVKTYCQAHVDRLREYKISDIKEGDVNPETIDMSYPVLPGSQEPHIHKNIKCCASAALLVFCQRYHQFPLCGGPDYSSSMVYEYNREDKNGDTLHFSRKHDLQILMMDKNSVISLVEFGKLPLKVELSFDLPFESQPGYSRVIFRNVAGRFSWLSKKLFAMKEPPNSPLPPSDLIDYTSHLVEVEDYPTLTPSRTLCRTDSGAPSLPSCPDSDRDCLFQTIDYIKATSPELPFYRELKKANRQEDLFNKVGSMLRNQKINEENAENSINSDTPDNLTISSEVSASRSNLFEAASPFQQCRGLASALGLLSWNKRYEHHGRQVELLDQSKIIEKEKDVCGALNELDNVFNREIHKFGLIYIARGDEKRKDALSHNVGSKEFEEFVAGLGWEVNWRDLHGYVPTIGTDVMKSTTVHYANATLEIVFHVGTRLEPGNQEAALYRFKYIGNDYIGVIWSEHDRDVNIDTFKSAYLNYVIVIYPMRDLKKCRVQVIVNFRDKEEKCKIEHGIGPLFDGALVDRDILPDLVRKTIINAERAITVDQNRPRFYRDRARNLDKLQSYKRDVTFEEFACELMSPSLIDFDQYKDYARSMVVDAKQPPQRTGSNRIYKRTAARQSTGYSSQDNMSESERAEKKKKWAKRDLSDSDNVYTTKR